MIAFKNITKKEFLKLYKLHTNIELAKETGLSLSQINYRVKKFGLPKKKAGRPETIK